jgi:hypothetical protein
MKENSTHFLDKTTGIKTPAGFLRTIEYWIENHPRDFMTTELNKRVSEYLIAQEDSSYFMMFWEKTKSFNLNAQVLDLKSPTPTPSSLHHHSVIETLHPKPAAEQLTLIEFDLYKDITETDLIGFATTKQQHLIPSVSSIASRFNNVVNWVSAEILSSPKLKVRAKVLKKIIQIGQEAFALHNFQTCFQIVCALESSPISRLKKTWEVILLIFIELTFRKLEKILKRPFINFEMP